MILGVRYTYIRPENMISLMWSSSSANRRKQCWLCGNDAIVSFVFVWSAALESAHNARTQWNLLSAGLGRFKHYSLKEKYYISLEHRHVMPFVCKSLITLRCGASFDSGVLSHFVSCSNAWSAVAVAVWNSLGKINCRMWMNVNVRFVIVRKPRQNSASQTHFDWHRSSPWLSLCMTLIRVLYVCEWSVYGVDEGATSDGRATDTKRTFQWMHTAFNYKKLLTVSSSLCDGTHRFPFPIGCSPNATANCQRRHHPNGFFFISLGSIFLSLFRRFIYIFFFSSLFWKSFFCDSICQFRIEHKSIKSVAIHCVW